MKFSRILHLQRQGCVCGRITRPASTWNKVLYPFAHQFLVELRLSLFQEVRAILSEDAAIVVWGIQQCFAIASAAPSRVTAKMNEHHVALLEEAASSQHTEDRAVRPTLSHPIVGSFGAAAVEGGR